MSRLDETVERVDLLDAKDLAPRRRRTLSLVFGPGGQASRRSLNLPAELVLGRDPGPEGLELLDPGASRRHARITFDPGEELYFIEDLGSRNGTLVNGRKRARAPLENGTVIRVSDTLLVFGEQVVPEGLELPPLPRGLSLSRQVAEAKLQAVAKSALPVLIEGPTGAGKEVLARQLHEKSGRRGPLVALNCATFHKELIGSELFGHVAGAFSGAATARDGLFLSARGGTLFLDEIAELPLSEQPVLLRALQERRVRPVGSDQEVEVDVRVVAATHAGLRERTERGQFRRDLLARLAGVEIALPGLAERREEILELLARFLEAPRAPTVEAAEALLLHDWPENIRELQHLAAGLGLFGPKEGELELAALPQGFGARLLALRKQVDEVAVELDRAALEAKLAEHKGNVAALAKALGKHRAQVYRWLRREGLDPESYRA